MMEMKRINRMKKTKYSQTEFIVFGFICAIIGILAYFLANAILNQLQYQSQYPVSSSNLSKVMKSTVNKTNLFYKYRFTNKDVTDRSQNITDLELNGGDCVDWTHYYDSIASKNNFSYYDIIIPINQSISHELSVIYNEEGYCVIDQQNIECSVYDLIKSVNSMNNFK